MILQVTATGTPFERGRAQAALAPADQVRPATVERVARARAEGVLDADALAYLAAQRAFHQTHDPEGLAELAGIAAGFDLPEADLFAHLHLGTLRDLKGGAALTDGCSAWAVPDGPDGPLVVKNRDLSGKALAAQCVFHHAGPDLVAGAVHSLGSLGSLAAWSSGINAAGLALADTQVAVTRHRVGWLRYFLMPRLLARATTVAQALTLIRSLPHAGGGTLILADRSGATAAVELSAAGPVIQQGGPQWRTNHYVTPQAQAETLMPKGDQIGDTSLARFAHLANTLPRHPWTPATARTLMADHTAPLCQHAHTDAHADDGAETVSSVIYSCSLAGMEISDGAPCNGQWLRVAPVP